MASGRPGDQLTAPRTRFRGVVLAGGRSTRMGADKAFVTIGGDPLVVRVTEALNAAHAREVQVVGGDLHRSVSLGLLAVPDAHPGEGPLGGLLTALGLGEPEEIVMVLACDLKEPSPAAIVAVVDALAAAPDAALAVPETDHGPQWLHAAWRPRQAAAVLGAAFDSGVRSVWRAAAGLERVSVAGLDPTSLADVDEPTDLPRGPNAR